MATPEEMAESMKANMKEKTGKSLPQWVKIAKASKLEKHGQIVKMLKADHGMTHGFANFVAHDFLRSGSVHADAGSLVVQQYAGKKAGLKPIYDALLKTVEKFGADVEISPKKSYVSLRRKKQFALIQPSTATRIDVGICAKGVPTTKRLEASGSFNAMCSHRVRLTTVKDVNAELRGWLKKAYDAS